MRFPAKPPPWQDPDPSRIGAILRCVSPTLPDGRYLHWNDLRWRPPLDGLNATDRWVALKTGRRGNRVVIPGLVDQSGQPFWFCRMEAIDRATHELDRGGVRRDVLGALGDDGVRGAYRIDQRIEEAISSSVLEGARLTTRAQAKQRIRDGIAPHGIGERMVVNNYQAMRRLLEIADRDLTLADLLGIHAVLGDNALDVQGASGRLRTSGESVRVEDQATGDVWFTPPPADQLPGRLDKMLAFANGTDGQPFLHPLLRAMVLHFWLAYLHPFVDGNGRMARAIFYWQMLRSGYDFVEYLSISGPIDRSRRAYYLAFAYTETDEGDLTYFFLHQLSVLKRATADLLGHIEERSSRLHDLNDAVAGVDSLNHRQQAVLLFLLRKPHEGTTVGGHRRSHDISYLTARKDLQDLETGGFLRRVRVGRGDRYFPQPKVSQLSKRI